MPDAYAKWSINRVLAANPFLNNDGLINDSQLTVWSKVVPLRIRLFEHAWRIIGSAGSLFNYRLAGYDDWSLGVTHLRGMRDRATGQK